MPEPLILAMRQAPCVLIDATRDARLDFLVRDYAYLGDDVGALQDKLHRLREHQSRETLERWKSLAAAHALPELFAELIDQHYDPLYPLAEPQLRELCRRAAGGQRRPQRGRGARARDADSGRGCGPGALGFATPAPST